MDYSNEPLHSERLVFKGKDLGKEPFNAEPVVSALVGFKYTPEDLVYCRNHGPVVELDEDEFNLSINGSVDSSLKLSMYELRTHFPKVEVVAALQVCYVFIGLTPEKLILVIVCSQ